MNDIRYIQVIYKPTKNAELEQQKQTFVKKNNLYKFINEIQTDTR